MRTEEEYSFNSTQEIFKTYLKFHHSLREDYYLNPTNDGDEQYESSRMNCLVANSNGIFGLYSLRSVQEYTKFYAFGCGEEFALGAMHAVYDKLDDAEEILRTGLEAAVAFNAQTDLPLEIFTLDAKE